jgi:hypothetical protein
VEGTIRRQWVLVVLVCSLAYLVCGIATADLARAAMSTQARNLWRLAAWAASLAIFGGQLIIEYRNVRGGPLSTALHCTAAVALGAFLLAAAGPVRTHWHTDDRGRMAALSLVAWPLATGVPAFVVAYGIGAVVRAREGPARPSRPVA